LQSKVEIRESQTGERNKVSQRGDRCHCAAAPTCAARDQTLVSNGNSKRSSVDNQARRASLDSPWRSPGEWCAISRKAPKGRAWRCERKAHTDKSRVARPVRASGVPMVSSPHGSALGCHSAPRRGFSSHCCCPCGRSCKPIAGWSCGARRRCKTDPLVRHEGHDTLKCFRRFDGAFGNVYRHACVGAKEKSAIGYRTTVDLLTPFHASVPEDHGPVVSMHSSRNLKDTDSPRRLDLSRSRSQRRRRVIVSASSVKTKRSNDSRRRSGGPRSRAGKPRVQEAGLSRLAAGLVAQESRCRVQSIAFQLAAAFMPEPASRPDGHSPR
jgi:hypothetical protein